mmetsp:Transcript_36673/g.60735  ORF Transcript_36673/g.60735 Transcript_36673/m.60735 type:complete len:240 (-) Transcript_36673:64-783(-)
MLRCCFLNSKHMPGWLCLAFSDSTAIRARHFEPKQSTLDLHTTSAAHNILAAHMPYAARQYASSVSQGTYLFLLRLRALCATRQFLAPACQLPPLCKARSASSCTGFAPPEGSMRVLKVSRMGFKPHRIAERLFPARAALPVPLSVTPGSGGSLAISLSSIPSTSMLATSHARAGSCKTSMSTPAVLKSPTHLAGIDAASFRDVETVAPALIALPATPIALPSSVPSTSAADSSRCVSS